MAGLRGDHRFPLNCLKKTCLYNIYLVNNVPIYSTNTFFIIFNFENKVTSFLHHGWSENRQILIRVTSTKRKSCEYKNEKYTAAKSIGYTTTLPDIFIFRFFFFSINSTFRADYEPVKCLSRSYLVCELWT